jgi:hypothetical protein
MFADNNTSISAAGKGIMITSTLVMIPTGKIRSWSRAIVPNDGTCAAPTEAISLSGYIVKTS